MGFTYVRVNVAAPGSPDRSEEIELLVDTGAILSIIPRPMLEREIGGVFITYDNARGFVSVLFGEEGDPPILGVTALEVMALRVDPRSGQLERTDILMLPLAR